MQGVDERIVGGSQVQWALPRRVCLPSRVHTMQDVVRIQTQFQSRDSVYTLRGKVHLAPQSYFTACCCAA